MRLVIISAICFFSAGISSAQDTASSSKEIFKAEMQLRQLSDSILKGSNDVVREAALAAFNPVFLDLLNNPATFEYHFDSLKAVSKIKSPDGLVRIYTWLIPSRMEGTYRYYGIIQRVNPGNKKIKTIGLMEHKLLPEEVETVELKTDTWFGAVYYEIIEKKINKKTNYILLGWQGNDRFTTRKVIELVY